jgi:SAM-dependent methyltransferase
MAWRALRGVKSPPPAAQQPALSEYEQRIADEMRHFSGCVDVHALPAIFVYWSIKHLGVKKFLPFGIHDPEQFFLLYTQKFHAKFPDRHVRILSIGSGNCDTESRLARSLLDSGITNFSVDCLDINEAMLARGRDHAKSLGVQDHIVTVCADFNRWYPAHTCDVILANQSLHHVVELEHLFALVRRHLNPEGYFLVSDMIGRNGHQRWPEALKLVQQFWQELPDSYRYNRLLSRHEPEYINHDCSTEGFEGIRAQDILPLLVQNFHFELFVPFGNIISVFIDRPFGHNFDANAAWDRDFIDRVHARDEEGLLSGELTPNQMIAVLRTVPVETQLLDPRLTPERCVRHPDAVTASTPPGVTG